MTKMILVSAALIGVLSANSLAEDDDNSNRQLESISCSSPRLATQWISVLMGGYTKSCSPTQIENLKRLGADQDYRDRILNDQQYREIIKLTHRGVIEISNTELSLGIESRKIYNSNNEETPLPTLDGYSSTSGRR